jgi:hypothetical protein
MPRAPQKLVFRVAFEPMSADFGWAGDTKVEILVLSEKTTGGTETLNLAFRDLESTAARLGFKVNGRHEHREVPTRGAPTFDGLIGPSLSVNGTLRYSDPRAEKIAVMPPMRE